MARINVETTWWMDERRYKLSELFNGNKREADGLALEAWKLSQEFWGSGRRKVPLFIFKEIKNHEYLLDVDLAIIQGNTVYVRGTKSFHEWYAVSKESASKGGKSKGKDAKRNSSEFQADAKSLYSSLSSLSSSLKEPKTNMCDSDESHVFDFELIYKSYPKRLGASNKGKGIIKLKRLIKSQQNFDDALNAVTCYKKHCDDTKKTGTELVKMFSTFFDSNGDWREWVNFKSEIKRASVLDRFLGSNA